MGHIDSLATPALLLDLVRFESNIERLRRVVTKAGVTFRPHVKTLKSPEAIRHAFGDTPVTVSTLLEAQRFAEAGFRDILYAVGIIPAKMAPVAALASYGIRMAVVLDDLAVANAVADALQGSSGNVTVLLEVDSDGHRSGVQPDSDMLLRIAAILNEHKLFGGVMTHAGGSYNCRSRRELENHAELERSGIVRAADRIRESGVECPVVSMGSTPTVLFASSLPGVTEVRAGVFMTQDLVMAGLGVCDPTDIAVSVLCSVIGHQRSRGCLVVDAGWMAMSRDRGTASQTLDQEFGIVCSSDGAIIDNLVLRSTNQEHGLVGCRDGRPVQLGRFPIGTRLRILPNHACATGAQHRGYHVISPQGEVKGYWERFSDR
jgi:D-serine deaminase-like pyridoxal phosphate-dependent protein